MPRIFLFLLLTLGCPTISVSAEELRLWFFLSTNLLVEANVDKGIELLNRASKAGYNGVLLTDTKFSSGILGDPKSDAWTVNRYKQNVKRFRDECRRLKIDCIAAVCPLGYANSILMVDPNFAEGQPVVDAPFIVKDGVLIPEPLAEPILKRRESTTSLRVTVRGTVHGKNCRRM